MRGGIVDKDTNATTTATNLPVVVDVCFPFTCINIPAIVGDNMTDANNAITGAGITGTISITYECNDTYAAGHVCRQEIACVNKTDTVSYVVSTGPCCTNIPPLAGLTKAQADAALTAAGFTPNGTGSVSCTGTYGYVLTQDTGCYPLPHTANYTYETGKTIASEIGQPKGTAEAAWTGQGFTLGTATPVAQCPAGNILSQDTGCKAQGYAVNYSYSVAPAVPNVICMTRAAAVTALTNAGFVVAPSSADVCSWGSVACTTVGNVFATSPAVGTTPGCGATITLSVVVYPVKTTASASLYANWVTNGKPVCWAYPRQCRGDADGKKSGQNWVATSDLTILKGAITKNPLPAGGTCADFDHKKSGQNWVATADLTIIQRYITKAESLVPLCGNVVNSSGDPNYWYWCTPTSTACPTGQYCATAGTCPNTP
jgi:beta-lactam-binding protein with PASTA domain